MTEPFETIRPEEIEKRSFAIITEELGERALDEGQAPVVKRVIHATADFDYADNLYFSPCAVDIAIALLKGGASIVSDTKMIRSGINQAALSKLGCKTFCFMSDPDIVRESKERGVTRASLSMEKAVRTVAGPSIFVIGNAPTALLRLYELVGEGRVSPGLVIGVPVGFVNVVESKELIRKAGLPCIVARGRKGGSTVGAAIVNALLYMAGGRD